MSSSNFRVLVVMLHGGNTPVDRVKSVQAYNHFKICASLGDLTGSQMHYTDSKGFAVFCMVLLVSDEYKPDTVVNAWVAACDKFEVQGAGTSYEALLDFNSALMDTFPGL